MCFVPREALPPKAKRFLKQQPKETAWLKEKHHSLEIPKVFGPFSWRKQRNTNKLTPKKPTELPSYAATSPATSALLSVSRWAPTWRRPKDTTKGSNSKETSLRPKTTEAKASGRSSREVKYRLLEAANWREHHGKVIKKETKHLLWRTNKKRSKARDSPSSGRASAKANVPQTVHLNGWAQLVCGKSSASDEGTWCLFDGFWWMVLYRKGIACWVVSSVCVVVLVVIQAVSIYCFGRRIFAIW